MKHLFILAIVFLTGCASVKFNGADTKITLIDRPKIGEIVVANIGDPLLQKGEAVEEKVLQVNKAIDGVAYDIPKGIYPQIGFDDKNDFYLGIPPNQ